MLISIPSSLLFSRFHPRCEFASFRLASKDFFGIIATHFKQLLYYKLVWGTGYPFVLGHFIVNNHFCYQSSTRVLNKKFNKVLQL